jgi:hypothetical protein
MCYTLSKFLRPDWEYVPTMFTFVKEIFFKIHIQRLALQQIH